MAKPWKTETSVFDRKSSAWVSVPLEIDIDWDKLARLLGSSAFDNKSGKSIALSGAIKCKVMK